MYLRILDPVQNQALRLCLGAFRTSPVSSLHVEAHEMPLDIRRRRLALQYCFKVSSNVTNSARSCIFNKSFPSFLISNQTRSVLLVSVLAVVSLRLVFERKLFCSTRFLLAHPGFTLYPQSISLYMHSANQTQVQRFLKVNFWNSVKTFTTIFTYTRVDLKP